MKRRLRWLVMKRRQTILVCCEFCQEVQQIIKSLRRQIQIIETDSRPKLLKTRKRYWRTFSTGMTHKSRKWKDMILCMILHSFNHFLIVVYNRFIIQRARTSCWTDLRIHFQVTEIKNCSDELEWHRRTLFLHSSHSIKMNLQFLYHCCQQFRYRVTIKIDTRKQVVTFICIQIRRTSFLRTQFGFLRFRRTLVLIQFFLLMGILDNILQDYPLYLHPDEVWIHFQVPFVVAILSPPSLSLNKRT